MIRTDTGINTYCRVINNSPDSSSMFLDTVDGIKADKRSRGTENDGERERDALRSKNSAWCRALLTLLPYSTV